MSSLRAVIGNANMDDVVEAWASAQSHARSAGLLTPRGWKEFLSDFKAPSKWTSKSVMKRVETNAAYYAANYLLLSGGVVALRIVFSPWLLITLALSAAITAYLTLVAGPSSLKLGDTVVPFSRRERLLCAGAVSLFLLFVSGGVWLLVTAAAFSSVLVLGHAVFKPRTASSRLSRMQGGAAPWLSGASAAAGSDADAPRSTKGLEEGGGRAAAADDWNVGRAGNGSSGLRRAATESTISRRHAGGEASEASSAAAAGATMPVMMNPYTMAPGTAAAPAPGKRDGKAD